MGDKEFDQYVKSARIYYKGVRSSRLRAIKFMQDSGILGGDCELSKDYKV